MNVEPNDDTTDRPSDEAREVLDSYSKAKNYIDDQKKYLWCELTFAVRHFIVFVNYLLFYDYFQCRCRWITQN